MSNCLPKKSSIIGKIRQYCAMGFYSAPRINTDPLTQNLALPRNHSHKI